MAPVLQCPDCGTKHPLGSIPTDVTTFPCDGCGRKLKVPESVPGRAAAMRPAPAAPPPAADAPVTDAPVAEAPPTQAVPSAAATAAAEPPRPAPPADATQAMPVVAAEPPPAARPVVEQNTAAPKPKRAKPSVASGAYAPVAWWIRLLLWVVAVPLAYFIVFELARVFGIFSSTNLTDVFLANGVSRFWPVARLLPVVALLTAILVQAGVMLLGRRKAARQGAPAAR